MTFLADKPSVELLVIFTPNFLSYPEGKLTFDLISFLIYIVPRLYIFIAFGDFFYEDFRISSVYVFTRKDNRVRWFIDKLFQISKDLVFYFVIITVTVVIAALVNNLPVLSVQHFLLVCTVSVVLNVIVILIVILLTNILSLYIMNAEVSLFITLLVYTFMYFPAFIKLSDSLQHLLIKINPVLQAVLVWHNDGFLQKYLKPLDAPVIPGFNFYWSLLILGMYLVLIILAGIKMIKTVEIIDRK